MVVNPNRDFNEGKGVIFPNDADFLIDYAMRNSDFLVQEKIKQHPIFASYHKDSLNTVRVYVYRSFTDDKYYIINTVFRMGLGGNLLDNITSGVIRALINKDGYVNGFAVDSYGKKYLKHPDTGLDFNFKIPNWEVLTELSINIARKILYARLTSLDIC